MRTGSWLLTLLLCTSQVYAKNKKDDVITIQSKDEVSAQTFEMTATPTTYATGFKLEDGWQKKAKTVDVKAQAALPRRFDWREQGKPLSPVFDQGNCGSCWANATVTVFQDVMMLKGANFTPLSRQYLLSCNREGWSCNGGFFAHEYHTGLPMGAVPEAEFPYVAQQVACKSNLSHPYHLTSWAYLPSKDGNTPPSLEAIKAAIYQYGPVAVAVGANNAFMNYSTGIFNQCDGTRPNHAVVLTGWDDDGQYFYLKNSWGERWGEKGHMKIKYGCNYIGLAANYVVYNSNPSPEPKPEPTVTPTPKPTPPDVPKCQPEPYANAGRDMTIRRGQVVKVGTSPKPQTTYRWEAEGYRLPNAPMFVVRPPKTVVFTLYATTRCGTARDSVLIQVR